MVATLALVGGCSGTLARAVSAPVAVATEAPAPVVLFRLLIIRSWSDPWYVIESEDHDFTLQEAIAFGIPAELWIRCAIENPGGFRQELFWVRPLRC